MCTCVGVRKSVCLCEHVHVCVCLRCPWNPFFVWLPLPASTLGNGEKLSLNFNACRYYLIYTKQFRKEEMHVHRSVNLSLIDAVRGDKYKHPYFWHL